MKIRVGTRGECEFPVFTAGNFEDFEDEFNRIMEHQGKSLPTGKTLGAYLTVAHVALKNVCVGLSREELRDGLRGAADVLSLVTAVIQAFGVPAAKDGEAPAGEAAGPSAST